MITATLVKADNILDIKKRMQKIGSDPKGIGIMLDKAQHILVYLTDVPLKAAIILKQEMLSKGGDAAVNRDVAALKCETTDILVMGTTRQIKHAAEALQHQPFGLKSIGLKLMEQVQDYAGANNSAMFLASNSLNLLNTLNSLTGNGASVKKILFWESREGLSSSIDIDGIWLPKGYSPSLADIRERYGKQIPVIVELSPDMIPNCVTDSISRDDNTDVFINNDYPDLVTDAVDQMTRAGLAPSRIWVSAANRDFGLKTILIPEEYGLDDAAAVYIAAAGRFTMVKITTPEAICALGALARSGLGYLA